MYDVIFKVDYCSVTIGYAVNDGDYYNWDYQKEFKETFRLTPWGIGKPKIRVIRYIEQSDQVLCEILKGFEDKLINNELTIDEKLKYITLKLIRNKCRSNESDDVDVTSVFNIWYKITTTFDLCKKIYDEVLNNYFTVVQRTPKIICYELKK